MDLAYSFAHDSDLDLNLHRVPDRSRALDRALDRVRDLDRDLDLALDRALVRDRGRRLDFDRAPRARDFDSTRIRPDDDGFIHIHTRDRVFARALGLGLGSHYWELLPALIDACGVILDTWTAVLVQPQTMLVRIERSIEGFLAAVVAQSADAMTHPTEDPARALHQISERLRNDPDSEAMSWR